MATYVYKCLDCDIEFERIRSMNDDVSSDICPECTGVCTQRLTSREGSFDSYFEGSYRADHY